jgi:hypothetical protein
MKTLYMPVGNPTYFEGDIFKLEDYNYFKEGEKAYGFFEVEVNAPLNLNIPLLQTRFKIKNGCQW